MVGRSYDALAAGREDLAFVCGLPYVGFADAGADLVALATVVYAGSRYAGRPVYFSELVVHADSPYRCFTDLAGALLAVNEPPSQSGLRVVRDRLAAAGLEWGFFGSVVESGFHAESLLLVSSGDVEVAAIDSHVLETLRPRPGPDHRGARPPRPARRCWRTPGWHRRCGVGSPPCCVCAMTPGSGIAGFAAVDGSAYDDIRAMDGRVTAAGVAPLPDQLASVGLRDVASSP